MSASSTTTDRTPWRLSYFGDADVAGHPSRPFDPEIRIVDGPAPIGDVLPTAVREGAQRLGRANGAAFVCGEAAGRISYVERIEYPADHMPYIDDKRCCHCSACASGDEDDE